MSERIPQQQVETVLALDRLIHEPARLAILTVLARTDWAEFSFLETLCALSKGNLSSHLSKLEEGGLIEIEKSFRGKRPLTRTRLTEQGQLALQAYRAQLAALLQDSE
ncbi:helix-turn-helix domain-containing protein [Permianibacter sp. IMCC34836]|uniref:transcriptional regulator n=1 Tax=Permianibacter fluminis TaxID=2738515 RepID=UPI0015562AF6|nr:transcriptional regulator [Permianibacter fluminis]NQD35453.1 helix-turn-helix domain-containing protein [Permianibacter fluminis]